MTERRKKITFVINGQLRKIEELKSKIILIFSESFDVELKVTVKAKDAIILAQNAVLNNSDFIIAVGGDGTLHEVINGIMNCPKEKRNHVTVGIIPRGSGNDFVKTMKIDSDIKSLIKCIESNSKVLIDIGKIELTNFSNQPEIKYFINIAEAGLGADVVRRVNAGSKSNNPTLNFFKSSLASFISYKKKNMKIMSDDFQYSGDVLVLCFANGKFFGSGLQIAPHAKVNDGKLSMFLAADVNIFDYLKNLFKIRKGKMIQHPEIYYSQMSFCTVENSMDECLVEADGELLGKLPAKFEILPMEINFIA